MFNLLRFVLSYFAGFIRVFVYLGKWKEGGEGRGVGKTVRLCCLCTVFGLNEFFFCWYLMVLPNNCRGHVK